MADANQSFFRRALRHRSFMIGGVLSLLLIAVAVFSLFWSPYQVSEIAMAM